MDNSNLLLLFERPREPVFVPKGDKKLSFEVPNEYIADKYKPIGQVLTSRFGEKSRDTIRVKKISIPSFDSILELGRNENFSLFIPKHQQIADRLIQIFMGMQNTEDLLSMACYARDRVNPYLFNYAYSVALLHRPDTKNVNPPSLIHSFPDKFCHDNIFGQAREEISLVPDGSRTPIIMPKDYTASDLEEEHRVAYFREDLGVNLHHWHWHLVYPTTGGTKVVKKDRRGELFYYMHQQILARYNFERLANHLRRVERLLDLDEPIKEAYFPKLNSLVASRAYPARVANQKLRNLKREPQRIKQDVADLKRWSNAILNAISAGAVVDAQRKEVELTEDKGIDILGNVVEASELSVNRSLYGNLHNMGHSFISYIHDPDHRYLENFGVMGDVSTAMRDPVFYRWHAFVDYIFQEHKNRLPAYERERLDHPGITITKIQVDCEGSPPNTFNTFWQQSDVDLSRGMDFQDEGRVFVRFTHLQRQPFTYTITVNNKNKSNKMGTCRIFLAPKHDERGEAWLFTDQRHMFIELDKFTVSLKQGQNIIPRSSSQSSVTIPFERIYRDLDKNRPKDGEALAQFNFCGCGWPEYLLIPKGTPEGMPCQLFVMISNYEDDKIEQNVEGMCNDAGSYCGIKDKFYPDRRSMGYPFDRLPREGVDTLQDFLTPNMRVQDVSIRFSNRTVRPKQVM